MGIRQEVAFKKNSEIFRRLAEVANVATLTPEERYNYEADVKNARDTLNQIRGAFQDGERQGIQKGIAKGYADAKRETAKSLLKLEIDPNVIAESTGLSIEEILSLQ